MNRAKSLKLAVLPLTALCFSPLVCLAQGNSPSLFEVITEVVKPGMTAKFEHGVKDVDAYAQSHGDTTGTSAFEVIDGPQDGNIIILVPFHWADRDHPGAYSAGLDQVAVKEVEPYLSSAQGGITEILPNLGTAAPANTPPEKYYELIQLEIKPGKMDDFLAAVRQISDAERKVNPQSSPVSFFAEVSGGDANQITVSIGHPDFADFGRPGKSILQVLREAYGEDSASTVWRALNDSIASEHNTIIQYRPDLSFTPSGQGG